ncbi:MAG TPA: hypothetical protein VMU50_15715 [Polyangia bacterium]|nr:hypothetical protein [Polyangia bacterium]
MPAKRDRAAEQFQTALDMFDFAESMVRQRISRENPKLSDDEVEARVRDWLRIRPGAEHGDGEGRPGLWPRTTRP